MVFTFKGSEHFIGYLKAHNFVWQGCFFFHYYLATLTTNRAQMFTHFVRMLRYSKWKDWSLTVTNSVHVSLIQKIAHVKLYLVRINLVPKVWIIEGLYYKKASKSKVHTTIHNLFEYTDDWHALSTHTRNCFIHRLKLTWTI